MATPTQKTNLKLVTESRPSRAVKQLTGSDAAVRMISETAHDIRAPLATVRESVRLVFDGDLGEINEEQKACLSAAIDQCTCVDQMVDEMMQLERLRTGIPRVRRRWVTVSEVTDTVDETLRPWAMPRSINVLWDVTGLEENRVFADVAMVRRLIVNLVGNAIRETAEGGSVLIRAQSIRNGEAVRWYIVDQGRGITETQMKEISQRQVSKSGGEGLGLSICRQLSALHFSPLRIESRAGTGTAVSFETPASSPAAVAECWARWRVNQREPMRRPVSRESSISQTRLRPPQRVRFDNPSPSLTVELASEGLQPVAEDRVASGIVKLGAAMPAQVADHFDVLLQGKAGMFDFIYRVEERQWVWILDADVRHAESRIDEINDQAAKEISDIRLSWSDPQTIPLDRRRTAARLSDLLVRQSLSAATVYFQEDEEVADETMVIEESPIPNQRLEQELQRLSTRLKRQTKIIHDQAKRLRPNF